MHLLVIMDGEDTPKSAEEIDDVVCAELPTINEEWLKMTSEEKEKLSKEEQLQLKLWDVVTSQMVHKPCGDLNPYESCMVNDKCRFSYPKK